MKELEVLLDNYWIIKNEDKELYYSIKDHLNDFKGFLMEKLGYQLFITPDVIKLEKIPGVCEPWMGITIFECQMEYAFLCLLLMFLEDKGKEEQFVLSNIAEFVQANFLGVEKVDWTLYRQRRYLIKIIKFACNIGLIKVNDGDEQKFLNDLKTEVLYESTGLSRYFVRNFTTNILNFTSYKDFERSDWGDSDSDKGIQRRQRVYRRLLMSPSVYKEGTDDTDFDYIKKQRSFIENDLEKYLGYRLHVHKNTALIVLQPEQNLKDTFPNPKAISDIVLLFNRLISEKLSQNVISINQNDQINISYTHFKTLIDEMKDSYSSGFSKEYKEMNFETLCDEIIKYMEEYQFIKYDSITSEVTIYSLVGKVNGEYPEDFMLRGDELDD